MILGESRRRQQAVEGRLEEVRVAATRVGAALQKLAVATSEQLGGDCYALTELGRVALQDLGVVGRTVVGLAAWRVGSGDSDAVSHVFHVPAHVPPGAKGLPFHTWLLCDDILVDFTTYQLRGKAAMLDALDGGRTSVEWCPPILVETLSKVSTYQAVEMSAGPGVFFYKHVPALQRMIEDTSTGMGDHDLAALRLIMANPAVNVFGPNHFGL